MRGAGSLGGRGLVYRSIIIRDLQPAASINSFSLPPSASQLAAKACRSCWGCTAGSPAARARSCTTW
jgi:hypothetical protein